MRRRRLLSVFAGAATVGIAGCSGGDDDNDSNDTNDSDGQNGNASNGDESDGNGNESDGNGTENGDESDGNGNESDGNGGGTAANLDVAVDPGVAGAANDFTFTVDGAALTESADIITLLVEFSQASGVATAEIQADRVLVTAANIQNPGVDSVQQQNPGELLVTPSNTFVFADVDGDILVGVGGIEVPESGEFDVRVAFQNDAGEAVVTAEGAYTIAAE